MRQCWNRQTGTFEGRVSYDVWVQVPFAAPNNLYTSGIEDVFSNNLGLYNQKRIKRTNRSILFTILCVLCLQIHLKFIIFKSFYNAFCYLIIHFTIPPYIIHSLFERVNTLDSACLLFELLVVLDIIYFGLPLISS